jgi:hypothetical protein
VFPGKRADDVRRAGEAIIGAPLEAAQDHRFPSRSRSGTNVRGDAAGRCRR